MYIAQDTRITVERQKVLLRGSSLVLGFDIHLRIGEGEPFKDLRLYGSYHVLVNNGEAAWFLGELGVKVAHRLLSFLKGEREISF